VGKLIISTAMTVDAVADVGEWFVPEGEHDAAGRRLLEESEAMLLGRKTYEGLAPYWSATTGAWADLINPMRKHVASKTLQEPLTWNATLIEGDAAEGVARLKAELEGDLFMSGCGELAGYLLGHELVDELAFWLHPRLWNSGMRPFESAGQTRLELLGAETYDSGVALLRYRPLSA
jgi:dihydrofolate reductase